VSRVDIAGDLRVPRCETLQFHCERRPVGPVKSIGADCELVLAQLFEPRDRSYGDFRRGCLVLERKRANGRAQAVDYRILKALDIDLDEVWSAELIDERVQRSDLDRDLGCRP
jgi:hypothetical protein